ncbi:beta/gamma crystallin domain-containing protein [Streptomyces sp. NPDC048636]|uniref:beta/gamma crystallin domain-containing protein n=1 Tax=Streptomyces sp. NPDC048636 TaxID=3155762 RepID=UPI0034497CFD
MKNTLKRIAVTAAAAAAVTALAPMSSASAISRTDCGNRTDFVKISNYGGTQSLCYANAGERSVHIYKVNRLSSGNNRVEFILGGKRYYLDKNRSIVDVEGLDQELTWIKIY